MPPLHVRARAASLFDVMANPHGIAGAIHDDVATSGADPGAWIDTDTVTAPASRSWPTITPASTALDRYGSTCAALVRGESGVWVVAQIAARPAMHEQYTAENRSQGARRRSSRSMHHSGRSGGQNSIPRRRSDGWLSPRSSTVKARALVHSPARGFQPAQYRMRVRTLVGRRPMACRTSSDTFWSKSMIR